jgi:putative chitinase
MDRTAFFAKVRRSLFHGRMTQEQVEGITRILDYRGMNWPKMINEELAYLLATAYHETGAKMQPIPEGGGERYLKAKPYYPWYGRGLVQITWKRNYLKWGMSKPDDALTWPNSLRIIFEGMIYGSFTGHKLSDYINADGQNFAGARAIVNGRDHAKDISDYAEAFLEAFHAGNNPTEQPTEYETEKYKMNGPLASILNMVVGNPLTGIPGAIGVIALLGPAVKAFGEAMIAIGSGANLWTVIGGFLTDPAVATFGTSIGLVLAKDHNVTGGTK